MKRFVQYRVCLELSFLWLLNKKVDLDMVVLSPVMGDDVFQSLVD